MNQRRGFLASMVGTFAALLFGKPAGCATDNVRPRLSAATRRETIRRVRQSWAGAPRVTSIQIIPNKTKRFRTPGGIEYLLVEDFRIGNVRIV